MTSLASLPVFAAAKSLPAEDFVDLYKLLGAAPDATPDQLRARISALYLEAQRNLDHHNFRKRFYYQQLFEVHLPQAYDCLLDEPRRAYYDACLAAYQGGEPFPAAPVFKEQGDDAMLPALGQDPSTEFVSIAEFTQTPNRAVESRSPLVTSSEIPSIEPLAPVTELQSPSTQVPFALPHQSETSPNHIELERRRDHKRRELIESEVKTAAWAWGSVGGAAVVGASFMVLAIGVPLVQRASGSASPLVLWSLGLIFSALLAGAAFVMTSRMVRRIVINNLSQMPYEALLRRCAL